MPFKATGRRTEITAFCLGRPLKKGKSHRCLLKKIREHLRKEKHQFITTEELDTYTGIASELINQYFTD